MSSAVSLAQPRSRLVSAIVKNVTSNWAGIVVGIVLSFLLAPITVNSLGNVYYGIWMLLMQFTGYLWLFDFGVRESVVKYVAQYHASDDRAAVIDTVSTAVSLYTIVACVTMAAVCGLAVALPYVFNIPAAEISTARLTALITGVTVAQTFVFNVFVGVLMGLQRYYVISQIGMVAGIVRAIVLYWLLTHGYGIIALAVVHLVSVLASNLLSCYLAFRYVPYLSLRLVWPRKATALKLLHYGKYVLLANLGDKIIFATDSIVIGTYLPISMLTFFAIGGSLIEYLRSFVMSMASILNPVSSSLEATRETQTLQKVFITGSKMAVVVGLPVCIGFILLGERFITLWMGPEYGPTAGTVLAVLALGHVVGLPYYTISAVLYGLGRHRIVALSRVIEGIANLVLSVVLVRRIGLVGVAWGTVIPHALVVGALLPAALPRMLPIDLREYYVSTYLRPLLASVPFCFYCWFVAHVVVPQSLPSFLLWGLAGMTTYIVPTWFIVLSSGERAHVRGTFGRRLQPHAA